MLCMQRARRRRRSNNAFADEWRVKAIAASAWGETAMAERAAGRRPRLNEAAAYLL
jgi:hypothetical protein